MKKNPSASPYKLALLILLIIITGDSNIYSQDVNHQHGWMKGWTIAPCYQHGKVFRHTPKFEPVIKNPSDGFEINFSKQTNGKQAWQQVQHYPTLGFALAYTNYGNNEVLGHGISFLPNIDLPLVTLSKFSLRLRIGSGIAFLSKHYEYTTNPTNNVIATTLNDITCFSASANWRIGDRTTLFGGGSFTHFSSGAVRIPNLGINIPSWNVGFRFQPSPYSKDEFIKRDLLPPTKKILFNISTGIGFRQAGFNGPIYHVFNLELSAGKMVSKWDRIGIGLSGGFNEESESFIKQQELYPDHFFLNSCIASGFIKNEFLFGYVGISLFVGYSFYHPSPLEYGFYQKLGIPVYLPPFGRRDQNQFSIGVYVTAGNFTAENVSLDLGFQF